MMARNIKSSGIPKVNKPEIIPLVATDQSEAKTKGISNGLKNPITKITTPNRSFAIEFGPILYSPSWLSVICLSILFKKFDLIYLVPFLKLLSLIATKNLKYVPSNLLQ
jgi:hypothetical protein